LAGIQYLDELFSAIRDAAEQLAMAEGWISHANGSAHSHWRMSFLQAARKAQDTARAKLDEATAQLAALGPPDRLPSLFAGLPKRLDELQRRLEASEQSLSMALDAMLQQPRGRA
jgi:hypothetical protein